MPMRTVIIDQEPFSSHLVTLLSEISDELCIVGRFRTAAEAMGFLRWDGADLLFWDMHMEELRFLRALRGAGCTTPVILLMSRIDRNLMDQAIALGAWDCILKPFDSGRLRHAVQNFLEQNRILHSSAELTQGMIDHLLHHPLPSESNVRLLPKGLNQRTLTTLERLIRSNPSENHTCESLSASSGLSKVTVRNYLNYLIEVGRLTCTTDYETGGRPRVLYRIV